MSSFVLHILALYSDCRFLVEWAACAMKCDGFTPLGISVPWFHEIPLLVIPSMMLVGMSVPTVRIAHYVERSIHWQATGRIYPVQVVVRIGIPTVGISIRVGRATHR